MVCTRDSGVILAMAALTVVNRLDDRYFGGLC